MRFSKRGPARYMGHLDLMRNFQRAAKRGGVALAYSQGFNPHPKLTFAAPLPLGAAGLEELAAFDLAEVVDPDDVMNRMNTGLPGGLRISQAWAVSPEKGTFGTRMESHYSVLVRAEEPSGFTENGLQAAITGILNQRDLYADRREGKPKDIRSRVLAIEIEEFRGTEAVVGMILIQDESFGAKPREIVAALADRIGPLTALSFQRTRLITGSNNSPSQEGKHQINNRKEVNMNA